MEPRLSRSKRLVYTGLIPVARRRLLPLAPQPRKQDPRWRSYLEWKRGGPVPTVEQWHAYWEMLDQRALDAMNARQGGKWLYPAPCMRQAWRETVTQREAIAARYDFRYRGARTFLEINSRLG